MGDLNYRIQTSPEMTTEIIKALADHYQYSHLLRHDQLLQQQKKGEAFSQFTEPPIDFKPTYKFDPSTNSWVCGCIDSCIHVNTCTYILHVRTHYTYSTYYM